MNIETDAIDALGASLDIADDVLGVYEELGKIPKSLPILGTLSGLSQILSSGLSFADGVQGWEVLIEISDALSGVCTIIAAIAPPTALVTGTLGALFETVSVITELLTGEFTSGLDIASSVLEGLGLIASIVGVVLFATVGTIPALIAGIVAGVLAFASIIVENWEYICEVLSNVWTSISEGFSACWDAIVQFFTETIQPIVQSVMDAFAVFGEFLSELWQSVGEFFSTCWDAIVLFFTETLPGVIDTVVNFFAELPEKIWEFLSQAATKIGEWATGLISKAAEVLPGVISSIIGFFSELPGKMLSVGGDMVKGIFNGISNSVQWLYGKLCEWVGSVIKYIKNLFGIHSPSAIMRDEVGKNLALGVAEGIIKNINAVSDAMAEMADTVSGTSISVEPEVKTGALDFESFKEKIRPSLDFVKTQIARARETLNTQFAASMQLAGVIIFVKSLSINLNKIYLVNSWQILDPKEVV